MADTAPGTAPLSDNRTAPRGVLPRGTQTWLMVGLALGILGIIVFAGHPEPAKRTASAATPAALAPQTDRLRDYQDRLRVLDERARQQLATEPRQPVMPQTASSRHGTNRVRWPDASAARRHGDRHGSDESSEWQRGRARELPRHECDPLARRPVRCHSGRVSCAWRDEACAGVWRDAPCRG